MALDLPRAIFHFHAFFTVDRKKPTISPPAHASRPGSPGYLACEPVVRQFLDVVYQAIQFPLPIDFLPSAQREAV